MIQNARMIERITRRRNCATFYIYCIIERISINVERRRVILFSAEEILALQNAAFFSQSRSVTGIHILCQGYLQVNEQKFVANNGKLYVQPK